MSTFAFAGVYLWTLAVPASLCVVMLIVYRPWPRRGLDGSTLELWLAGALACCALQLVTLPGPLVDLVSPNARDAWRRLALDVPRALPLSIDVDAGAWALLVAACTLVTFLGARRMFARGGVRRVTRAVAAIGFVVSALALAQDATARGLMYWRWAPLDEGAEPFGPFVNRNHFGTWVMLAAPLVFGYLAAHATAHHRSRPQIGWQSRLRAMADARTIWLTAATLIMTVALAASLSRSAMLGFAVAVALAVWFRPAHDAAGARRPERWIAVALLAVVAVLVRVDPSTLGARIATAPVSAANRLAIWRDTLPVLRDFWLTGAGAGTYETVMLLYQRAMPEVRFNQAHNHYLQVAAEGGLLLVVPLVMAAREYLRTAMETITSDDSGMYFVRAGAFCGLAGVAVQSVWETGLTTPANAFLAAVTAAIVIHRPSPRSGRPGAA